MLLAVDHEGQQFIDILFLISNDLQFRNLTVGENICKGYILAQFGFQIQSVALSRNSLYFTFTAVDHFKELVHIFDILYFHFYNLLSFSTPTLYSRKPVFASLFS